MKPVRDLGLVRVDERAPGVDFELLRPVNLFRVRDERRESRVEIPSRSPAQRLSSGACASESLGRTEPGAYPMEGRVEPPVHQVIALKQYRLKTQTTRQQTPLRSDTATLWVAQRLAERLLMRRGTGEGHPGTRPHETISRKKARHQEATERLLFELHATTSVVSSEHNGLLPTWL